MEAHTRTPDQFMAWMLTTVSSGRTDITGTPPSEQMKSRKEIKLESAQQNFVLAIDQTSCYRIVIPAIKIEYSFYHSQIANR